MTHLDKVNDEVFVDPTLIVRLGEAEIEFLKQQARSSPRGRARICAHKDTQDPLHQMLIALSSAGYVRPHKHLDKAESFHVVEGEGDVVVFKENGEISEVIPLGSHGSSKPFFYRLPAGYYHTILVHGEFLVVHEVTTGPFIPTQTEEAPFAPEAIQDGASREYLSKLRDKAAVFLKHAKIK